MNEIVITTAKRLPIGKFMGSLSNFSAPQLGSSVIDSVISESGISKDLIDEIIMGQVLTGGSGQNPARQASMLSDLPEKVSALTDKPSLWIWSEISYDSLSINIIWSK